MKESKKLRDVEVQKVDQSKFRFVLYDLESDNK